MFKSMSISYRLANRNDYNEVFELVREIQNQPLYSRDQFQDYWIRLYDDPSTFEAWIVEYDSNIVGYIFVNILNSPRYIGVFVEFEEIVISPKFQRRGIGGKFISHLIEYYSNQESVRKVMIKSDDLLGSAKLYNRLLNKTNMVVFQKFLNKI